MPINADDTIFARASGAGRAGVAVFRISGPRAIAAARALSGAPDIPNRASLRAIRDISGGLIDEGLVILFRGPASFTGEDVAELHLHGSKAVEAALYDALLAHGLRPAEAGEFTRRALLNGKLDLAEIEGLADLIDAETSLQRKQALGQFGGRLSNAADAWRARLIAIMAPLEAGVDFPDEADVPAEIGKRAAPEIEALIAELQMALGEAARGEAIREGVSIAIIGAPNAGKSSLLNRLVGSERAIVSETPGTTRDAIEARLDLGGMLASVFDTAGLREETGDFIEKEGMARARALAAAATIRILMIDLSAGADSAFGVSRETNGERMAGFLAENDPYGLLRAGDLVVLNKIDAAGALRPARLPAGAYPMSAKTGEGFAAFLAGLTARAAGEGRSDSPLLTRARHTEAVSRAVLHLEAARGSLARAPELAAEDVRLAARALGGITGAVGVEDVLDAIFSSFCIGK